MTIINHTVTHNPLQAVVAQFEEWRKTRLQKAVIPDSLWSQVQSLGDQYSYAKLTKALRVNHSQLKRHLHQTPDKESGAITLVECAPSSSWSSRQEKECSITFSCKNGMPVTVNGLRGMDLTSAISTLMGG